MGLYPGRGQKSALNFLELEMQACISLLCRCWDLSSGPHCSASTLAAEPSLQSWILCSLFSCYPLLQCSLIFSNSRGSMVMSWTYFYEDPLMASCSGLAGGSALRWALISVFLPLGLTLFGHGEVERESEEHSLILTSAPFMCLWLGESFWPWVGASIKPVVTKKEQCS